MKKGLYTNGYFDVEKCYLWFSPCEQNLLIQYNIKKKKTEKIYLWENTNWIKGGSYCVKKWNEQILVIPARDNKLRIVDSDENISELLIDTDSTELIERYQTTIIIGERVIIFPIEKKEILELSNNQIKKIPTNVNNVIGSVINGENIYLFNCTKIVWKYSVRSSEMSVAFSSNYNMCWGMKFNNTLIVLTTDGYVLSYDETNLGDYRILFKHPERDYFSTCVILENTMILFPYKDSSKIWKYDFITEEIESILIDSVDENMDWQYNSFSAPCVSDGIIWSFCIKKGILVSINKFGKIIDIQKVTFDDKLNTDKNREIMYKDKADNCLYQEDGFYQLKSFMDYVYNKKT